MKPASRAQISAYFSQIARINGVTNVSQSFNVTPSVQQTLETKIQESSAFLRLVNFYTVDELQGQKIGMGVASSIAGRTDTETNERQPRSVGSMDAKNFQLYKTDYDTFIKFAQIDQWAKFKDFQNRMRDLVINQIALDRIKIAFNGRTAAAETNPVTNPMLEDVNIGWLQQYRNNAPARVMHEVRAGSKVVKVGQDIGEADGYRNLAALVFDAINSMVHPAFRKDPRIRVILGADLSNAYLTSLLNRKQDLSEQKIAEDMVNNNHIALREAIDAPFVPDGTMLITMPQNLSIYTQEGSMRRHVIENPKRDRIEDYRSANEGFVVEQYEAGCVVENIQLVG